MQSIAAGYSGKKIAYLLHGDVYGFIENDPNGSLPAAWVRSWALVRHVLGRVRQQHWNW